MAGRPFLKCLGQPTLFTPGGEPVRFRTKKHLALLVYLGVEPPRPHRRDRLAAFLWPNVGIPEARHSLATALSVLRPRLGPGVIQATREHVCLTRGGIELDLDRLQSGAILASDTREALEVADFLDGFDISDSPEFSLWKDRKRASLLPRIKAALVQLIDTCRRTSDARQMEHLADAMLAIDELSEEAIRAKMEARAFAGDRLTALRVYEDWRERLAELLGAQPSALLEGMAVRLRKRGWERADSDISTVPTDQWRDRLFVGRFDQYRSLYEAWERTKRGRAHHALVLGDSGVGKTTLVNRLVTAAGLEGAAVSRAQCYDLEGQIPYATLGNLMLGILDLPGISTTPPAVLAELAQYFQDVRHRFPTLPPAEESHGDTGPLRLTEAFCQTLESIAEEHPVILVVDDLHFCDEASLSVLGLLMHKVSSKPIMAVLVARVGELSRSPNVARLRFGIQGTTVAEIEVSPLSEAESNEVLGGLLGTCRATVDSALRRAMVHVAGGFPMILELLVKDWEVNGSHSLALALDSITADFGSASDTPELYAKVLDRMVCTIDHSTRNVLNVAAVLGHRLNELSLYGIADLGPGQVMSAMADLVRHRILRDSGRGLEFVNEFVRTAAYLEVPSPVRRALHSGIAARLMEEDSRGVQFLGLEIAWHAIRAGKTTGLAGYLLKGAQEAIGQGALDTAARALISALPQLAAAEREAAALLLAEVLQEQGRWAESASVVAVECSQELSGLGTLFSIVATHRTAAPTAEQLVRDIHLLKSLIDSERPLRVRLKAVNAASQLMGDIRDRLVAAALCESASKLRDSELAEDDRAQLELCRAQLMYYSGQQEAAYGVLTSLVSQFNQRRIVNSRLARVHGGLGAVRCWQGKYEEAQLAFHAGYSVATRIGNEPQQAILSAQLALCSLRLGEYNEVLAWSEKVASIGPFLRYQEIQVAYYRGFALAMMGDVSAASSAFDSLETRIPPGGPAWLTQAWQLFKADVLYLCGRQGSALSQAAEAVHLPSPKLYAPSFAGIFARWLALVSTRLDQTETARRLLNDLAGSLTDLDAIDKVEILCGLLLVEDHERSDCDTLVRSYLSELPSAVAGQLQRLGVLRTEN